MEPADDDSILLWASNILDAAMEEGRSQQRSLQGVGLVVPRNKPAFIVPKANSLENLVIVRSLHLGKMTHSVEYFNAGVGSQYVL